MIQKNHRGQALIEFVILLPIFIFMLFAVIDFGKILYTKNNLESKMDDVITLYEKEKNLEEIKERMDFSRDKITIEKIEEGEYAHFILKKDVEIITPGLNLIFGSPYLAKVKRVIYDE